LSQSLEIIGTLQKAASTNTKPGSSHKEDKIKPLGLDKIYYPKIRLKKYFQFLNSIIFYN